MPKPTGVPPSDLSRAKSHEPDTTWPEIVEIVLWWRGRNGKMTSTQSAISADQFFGHGIHGAPLSGEHLISTIERLRRSGPPAKKAKK